MGNATVGRKRAREFASSTFEAFVARQDGIALSYVYGPLQICFRGRRHLVCCKVTFTSLYRSDWDAGSLGEIRTRRGYVTS